MGMALRKTLALAALTVTASLLPVVGAGAAGAAEQTVRVPGRYCLANAWNTPDVASRPCDTADRGQHWIVRGQQIALAHAPAYCLANTWNTPKISTKPCDPNDQGQYWNLSGQRLSLAFAPAYCLANAWGTPDIATKPCDNADRGQNWAVFNDQISLALA
ncbi:ricin-type beta-trefoil lectin domain protein [Streptomyces sp. NPDC097619]|uniref:ricin-type beta-trefoil lectin domain protein n=1 Tax=Streptomyces sp. NPDC097619 TaxID=3157228 RepID=UPI00332432C5